MSDTSNLPATVSGQSLSVQREPSDRRVTARIAPIVLGSFQEVLEFSMAASRSTMVPVVFRGKPEDCAIAVMFGGELGLPPIQSLQSIAVINGRPSVWGDAVPGLCWASGKVEDIEEYFEGEEGTDAFRAVCIAKRRGASPKTGSFSQADAKKAGLFGQATHGKYPKRMMQWRARHFALHDAFPDVLRGIGTVELEAEDAVAAPAWNMPRPERSWFERKPLALSDGWDNTWFEGALKKLVGETNAWKWLELLLASLDSAPSLRDVDEIFELPIVQQTLEAAPEDARATIDNAFLAARERLAVPPVKQPTEKERLAAEQKAAVTRAAEQRKTNAASKAAPKTDPPKDAKPTASEKKDTPTADEHSGVAGGAKPADRAAAQQQQKPAQAEPAAAKREPPAAQPGNAGAAMFFLADENGDEVDDGFFDNPVGFAGRFIKEWRASSRPEALRQSNLDAIEDARAASRDATTILAEIEQETPGEAEESESAEDGLAAGVGEYNPKLWLVAIPRVNGRPALTSYVAVVRTSLASVTREGQIIDWIAINEPTYEPMPRATKMAIEQAIQARRAEISGPMDDVGPTADEEEAGITQDQPEQPRDADRERALDRMADIRGCKTEQELRQTCGMSVFRTLMERFKRERPELHKMVDDESERMLIELQSKGK